MSNQPSETDVQHQHSPSDRQSADRTTDASLLERYVRRQDQEAFADLVRRHGPMVLAVCRRVLQHTQDAEDTFQATFLVLVRKAATLDQSQPLAGWLYTVAYQTALNARGSAAARRHREAQAMSRPIAKADEPGAAGELRLLLDAELSQLPDKYRLPVILCYLDGRTNEEAARQLGWPVGTVKVRLARARDQLRNRLSRRGLAISVLLLTDLLAEQARAAPLASGLVDATVDLASHFAAGTALSGAGASAAGLAEGVLQAMKAQPAIKPFRQPVRAGKSLPAA